MVDRIAEIWGSRTPYDRSGSWPVRVDQALAEGVTADQVDSGCSRPACCAATVAPATSRSRTGKWSVSGAGRGRSSTTAGSGPKGLFGSWQGMSASDRLTRPSIRRRRRTGGDGLGHRDVADRRTQPRAARRIGPAVSRLLHHRAAVPGGVLRAVGARQGRYRHPPHGRQHPAVHGDRGRGDEGELRLRRPAGQLRRPRPLRRRCSCSATTWPRPRPCCGRGYSTGWPGRDPPWWCAWIRARRRLPGRATVHLPAGRAPTSR